MTRAWNGPARYLFIPLVVTGTPGYRPPPAHYRRVVQQRVWHDPDPQTGEDVSLAAYLSAVSYGQATLSATVARPVALDAVHADQNPTSLAIEAHPAAHEYEYVAVVYPPGEVHGSGQAVTGSFPFSPPRSPNRTKARCRFRVDAHMGTWAMEVLHNVTEIGDYYNGVTPPDRFDEMSAAEATHPCAYTKALAGWLGWGDIATHPAGDDVHTYNLHALGLAQPMRPRHVAAVKIQAPGSDRYLIAEARPRSDRWERGVGGSHGIPSEGVVIYEFSPETDSWPKVHDVGPWPPLELRTPTALKVGQTFTHHDPSTPGAARDHRAGVGRHRTLTVRAASVGGFVVDVVADDRRGSGSGRARRARRGD